MIAYFGQVGHRGSWLGFHNIDCILYFKTKVELLRLASEDGRLYDLGNCVHSRTLGLQGKCTVTFTLKGHILDALSLGWCKFSSVSDIGLSTQQNSTKWFHTLEQTFAQTDDTPMTDELSGADEMCGDELMIDRASLIAKTQHIIIGSWLGWQSAVGGD